MKVTVMIHEADEGGYWAEVPALPGCFTQGETLDEVRERVREAIAAHLDVPLPDPLPVGAKVQEVEV
jgi:predicted RNase H-like HicB family nuclease